MNDSEGGKSVIDVIEDFDYSTQSDKYNKAFKNWRKSKSNPYTYNFSKNKREHTFIEGRGFMNTDPADAEKTILNRVLFVIGMALFISISVETFFSKFIVKLLSKTGVNLWANFLTDTVYGGEIEVLLYLIITGILKLGLPILFIHRLFKMPNTVRFPHKLSKKSDMCYALSICLMLSVLTSFSSAYFKNTTRIFEFFKLDDAEFATQGVTCFVIYAFFDVLIVSILSEMLFRGEMLASLRQFGDLFAVTVCAFVSTAVTADFAMSPCAFAIAMLSGIMVLKSGSIITAICIRALHSSYLIGLAFIVSEKLDVYRFLNKTNFATISVGLSAIIAAFTFMLTKSDRRKIFANFQTYLSRKDKVIAVFQCSTIVISLFICCTIAYVKLFV